MGCIETTLLSVPWNGNYRWQIPSYEESPATGPSLPVYFRVIITYPSTGWGRGVESFQIWTKETFHFSPTLCRWHAPVYGGNEIQLSKVLECLNLLCEASREKESHGKTTMYFFFKNALLWQTLVVSRVEYLLSQRTWGNIWGALVLLQRLMRQI